MNNNRIYADLKLPLPIHILLMFLQTLIKALTGNANFPNPTPTVAALTQALTALTNAEATALTRAKGAVAVRDARKKEAVALLQQYRAYVQSVADADPDNATNIIESAGLSVRKPRATQARVFSAKRGNVSGSAIVVAPRAAARASYDWEMSTDGGKTWAAMPGTLKARTSATGLPVGTTVQFRYRALTKTGEGDWSAPVSLAVL